MKLNVEKECTSCGEKGHHWNECKKVSFVGLLAGATGLPTKPFCGMEEIELLNSVDKHIIKRKQNE